MKKILISVFLICITLHVSANNQIVNVQQDTSHDNELTIKEANEGWRLLFDGKSMDNWRMYKNLGGSWAVNEGMLCSKGSPNGLNPDVITIDTFRNFELQIDWKISPHGNSGIMYLVTEEYEQPYLSGPEYQLIDDDSFPAKLEEWQKTGANYAMQPPSFEAANAPGEWNHTVIVVDHGHVEHWLNGKKVVEYQLWSDEWKHEKATGKWKDAPGYGSAQSGHIALQASHTFEVNSGVCFKNIKIKNL